MKKWWGILWIIACASSIYSMEIDLFAQEKPGWIPWFKNIGTILYEFSGLHEANEKYKRSLIDKGLIKDPNALIQDGNAGNNPNQISDRNDNNSELADNDHSQQNVQTNAGAIVDRLRQNGMEKNESFLVVQSMLDSGIMKDPRALATEPTAQNEGSADQSNQLDGENNGRLDSMENDNDNQNIPTNNNDLMKYCLNPLIPLVIRKKEADEKEAQERRQKEEEDNHQAQERRLIDQQRTLEMQEWVKKKDFAKHWGKMSGLVMLAAYCTYEAYRYVSFDEKKANEQTLARLNRLLERADSAPFFDIRVKLLISQLSLIGKKRRDLLSTYIAKADYQGARIYLNNDCKKLHSRLKVPSRPIKGLPKRIISAFRSDFSWYFVKILQGLGLVFKGV